MSIDRPHIIPLALMLIAILAASPNAEAQAGIFALGTLGGSESLAHDISDNGQVVVGRSSLVVGDSDHAMRWTASGGMRDLGTLGGDGSSARAVSADGNVIVGFATDSSDNFRAFRWTQGSGMVDLGTLGGDWAMAHDTSANGSVVVGAAHNSTIARAFRWTQAGGMVDLGTLGGSGSSAYGVSGDGSVVVGNSQLTGNASSHPFRWTQAGGMVDLGTLPGGNNAYANRVSADGNVVVGYSYINATELRAFRWSGGAMASLGSLGGDSEANGVSADGSVIVGKSGTAQNATYRGFRWTQGTGMQTIEQWLTAAGVNIAPGLTTEDARGISADGSIVVGQLSNGRAFIARSTGLIDPQQAQQSVGSTGVSVVSVIFAGGTLGFSGAHSIPLSRRVDSGKKTFWMTGDWGRATHQQDDADLGLTEAGFGYNFGPAQINLSVGQTWARQDLDLDGHVKADGTYFLAEALIPLTGNLWSTLGAYVNRGDVRVRRGYLNAGLPDHSSGHPDVTIEGLRARFDWEQALVLSDASISPYVDLSHFRAKLDAYTESGGGFPARFDSRTEDTTELRLGLTADKPLTGDMKLVGLLEGVHRFDESGVRTTGEIVGLFGFDIEGEDYRQNWLRLAIGSEGTLGGGRASLMLNATTQGEAPSYWLSATWQKSF